jgi:hypothetical protein
VIAPLPGISLPCFPSQICSVVLPSLGGSAASIGGSVAKVAAEGVLDALTSALSSSASWLLGHLIDLINQAAPVNLGTAWFSSRERAMVDLLELVVLPVLMAATAAAVLKQDLRRLGRIWAVGLPVALIAGVGGVQFADLALSATDAMCQLVSAGGNGQLSGRFSDVMFAGLLNGAPQVIQLIVFVLMIVGAVLVWIELLLRAAAVYIAMFFMPLALAAYVWPATANIAKRTVEVLVALILSKFVIVAALTLGLAALSTGTSADDAISASAILLIAGFAPFTLLRLAPVVEAAAIAHLEGVSRRPFRAASRAASFVAAPAQNPAARLLLSRMGPATAPAGPSPVFAAPLPQARADYPPTSREGSEDA